MTQMTRRLVPLAAALALLALAAPSMARRGGDGDGRVLRTGSCTAGSDWKLKAKPDDGRLEVEFEVDQNRSGVRWNVAMRRDGNLFARTSRTTRPPSGSFEVERRAANRPGRDRITAIAKRRGETCRAALTI